MRRNARTPLLELWPALARLHAASTHIRFRTHATALQAQAHAADAWVVDVSEWMSRVALCAVLTLLVGASVGGAEMDALVDLASAMKRALLVREIPLVPTGWATRKSRLCVCCERSALCQCGRGVHLWHSTACYHALVLGRRT